MPDQVSAVHHRQAKLGPEAHAWRAQRSEIATGHAASAAMVPLPVRPELNRERKDGLSADDFNEMGPIDYILVEWPGRQPTGEARRTWSTSSTAA